MSGSSTEPLGATALALVAAVVTMVAAAGDASAGPWVKEPGEVYAKLSGSHFRAVGTYDRAGEPMDPNYTYSHVGARLYADIGVVPDVGVSVSLPYLVSKNALENSGAEYIKRGLGDLDLAAEYGTTYGQLALSGQLKVRLPLYPETISANAAAPNSLSDEELERRRFIPALGDGSVDLTPRLQLGVSLHPFPGWVTAAVGPKFRFQGFGHALSWAVSGGAFVLPERLAFTVRAGGLQRFQGGNRRPTKSYLQLSGGTIVRIAGGVSLEASAGSLPVGAFVSKGWSVTGGVSFDGRLFPNPWKE